MVLSFSFMELGQLALSVDDAWITPLVVRTSVMKNIIGGWSHVLRVFLETLLLGPHGLETSGVPLVLNGVPVLFFAKLGTLLSDGDGHRTALDWRGAQCLKPCVKHFNVWKKDGCGMHPLLANAESCCREIGLLLQSGIAATPRRNDDFA